MTHTIRSADRSTRLIEQRVWFSKKLAYGERDPYAHPNSVRYHLGGEAMDKDKVKGTIDDVAGRTKRQIGEWTDDPNKQVEGTAQQIKGKVEKASGNVKDAVRGASRPSARSKEDDLIVDNEHTPTSDRR
jgi:uncharacterized protein YjbJ (UPF0337 family)